MVGDSYPHDVEGAMHVGMRGILVQRTSRTSATVPADVPVIRDLSELPALIS
jgi:FMN phosphatase YigB (HAD superfamily)